MSGQYPHINLDELRVMCVPSNTFTMLHVTIDINTKSISNNIVSLNSREIFSCFIHVTCNMIPGVIHYSQGQWDSIYTYTFDTLWKVLHILGTSDLFKYLTLLEIFNDINKWYVYFSSVSNRVNANEQRRGSRSYSCILLDRERP